MTIRNLLKQKFNFSIVKDFLGIEVLKIDDIEDTSIFSELNIDDMEIESNSISIPTQIFASQNIYFFNDYESFVEIYPNYYKLQKEKKEIFFLDKKRFLSEIRDNFIKSYKSLKCLDVIFEKISFQRPKESENHTFTYEVLHKRKTLVKSKIGIEDITNIDKRLSALIKLSYKKLNTQNELDKEVRITFLKKAIEDVFPENEITFTEITQKFEVLMQQYEIITRAYIEELDTEKIKYDYEKKIQDINEKLSLTTSDIHTKLILLPLGFVVAVAQMRTVDFPLEISLIILLGLIIFTTIINLFTNTQKKLIINTEVDIKYWEKFYKKHLISVYESEIKIKIDNIKAITESIKHRMFITIFLSWLLVTVLFIYIVFRYSN